MKEFIRNLKFLWQYSKDLKWKLVKYSLCNIIGIIISVVVPVLSAKIIVHLTDNMLKQVLIIAIVLFLVENIRNLIFYMTNYYSQIINKETFINIETALGKEIVKIENEVIDNNSSGLFIQRLTGDTKRLSGIFNNLNINITGIITDVGIFMAIFYINKLICIYFIVMIIIIYIIEKIRCNVYERNDKIYRERQEKVTGFIGELIRGLRDIKMLNAEKSFLKELHLKIKKLNTEEYKMYSTNRGFNLLSGFFQDTFDLGLIVILIILISQEKISIANALIIKNYSYALSNITYFFSNLIQKIKDFNLSSSRVFSIIKGENFKKESFGDQTLKKANGDFEFRNVSFKYSDSEKYIFKNLSFKVNANETVAFVGKSGAGKTTIFNLLCKMYDINEGSITIDGIDIRKLDKNSIRGNITIISQNPYIFNLSIKDNFRLVKEKVTIKEIKEVCKIACLDEFIESLPDKYNTIIGEGGVNLSGGQRQRFAIARALIQKTEIILFDEATSALDNETQSKIQQAIENMKKEYTILIIAHRLSTVINSDRILFLDNGKIIAEGKHNELLKTCKKYKELYEAELKNT